MDYRTAVTINVRKTPGHIGQQPGDVLTTIRAGSPVELLDQIQYQDGLFWRLMKKPAHGWIADKLSGGEQVVVSDALPPSLFAPLESTRVTQRFGGNCQWYCGFVSQGVPLRGHNGIDYGVVLNTPVLATDNGIVIRTGWDPGGYGHYVKLRHFWGESLYAHLSQPTVSAGKDVGAKERIGLSGNTGNSTGPHLHFAIRIHPFRQDDGWAGWCDPINLLVRP